MSARRHSAARAVLVIALTCGTIGSTVAQEKSAPATSAPGVAPTAPVEDSIAAAKREFDAVKSTRGGALQPKGDLPRLSMPELRADSPAGSSWSPAKSPIAEKKSQNWLVEAMDKKTDARDGRERDGDRVRGKTGRDRLSPLSEKASASAGAGEDSRARDEVESSDRATNPSAANPLARYLVGWMTPQVYALLKPGLEQSLSNSGAPLPLKAEPDGLASVLAGGLAGTEFNFGAAASSSATTANRGAPGENPYLQGLNIGPASPTAPSPMVSPTTNSLPSPSVSPMPSPMAAPPPLPPAKTKIPEFAKPATDEKYFKPLKRF